MLSSKVYTLQGSIRCIIDLIFLSMNTTSYPLVLINGPLGIDLPAIRMDKFRTEDRWEAKYKPNMNLIYVKNSKVLYEFLSNFFLSRFMTSRSRFLFYGNISSDATSIVKKFYVNDAIFFDLKRKKIFTYYPLRNKNIRRIDTRLVKVGTCKELKKIIPWTRRNYIDYKGWTLKIQNVYCKPRSLGLDTLKMVLDHWQVKYDIKCKGGSILYKRVMEEHDFDILVHNYHVSDASYGVFPVPYHFDTISVYFLGDNSSLSWNHFLLIFTTSVWWMIAVTLILLSICWLFIQFTLRNLYFSDIFTIVFTNFIINFKLKKTKYCSEFIFILFFFISSLSLGAIYKGALFYTEATYEASNSTALLQDLPYRIIAYPTDLPTNLKYMVPFEKRIECDHLKPCVKNAISVRHMAVVMFDQESSRFRQSLENDTVKFFKVTPPLKDVRLSLFFAKGHPLVDIYSKYIQLFRENGILYRLIEEFKSSPTKETRTVHGLKLSHMKIAFFLLGMGIAMSLIIFTIEHITLFQIRVRFVV